MTKSGDNKSGDKAAGSLLRDQLLRQVGEQLLNSDTVREVVKKEVLRSVVQAAGKAATSSKPSTNKATTPADLGQQVSEVWQHPAVQSAVKGGLKTVSSQARQWRDKARSRAEERQDEELLRKQARGETLTPAEEVQLAQRRAARERLQRQQEARAALLAQAQTPAQRQVLELLSEHTPWLGGSTGPLRYTQLLDQLAPTGSAEQEMSYHRALWSLAEMRLLAVSPHGEIALMPLDNSQAD